MCHENLLGKPIFGMMTGLKYYFLSKTSETVVDAYPKAELR
jgi:hypothetical protein